MSGDFYKEWREKAEVDYFPQLVVLWLSTNAWYRSHYSEITTRKDRDFLNKLRDDHSTRNKIYTRFDRLLSSDSTKEHAELINVIEALSFALNSAQLLWDENNTAIGITLTNCLLTPYPKTYGSLVVKKNVAGIQINKALRLTNNRSVLFNGLLEIIYQVRCQLVHGQLEPSEVNHEVVKQVYFLLHLLMRI
ncbi:MULTISPECIES: hypothetical protein [Vibrio]|uniref:hypothetical protein n=1 Tax=Vibrio TaxID=662 RepID=UPI00192BBFC7|nr:MULTISPECIES: hypothetical protein [Vibrio]MBL4295541.1 hypothetical protein [Vibrio fluvialis]MBY8192052.1 hypothetical protein [Vibrio fluvialis]MCA0767064.1 hypothetical protein [Vibrio vulnificus]MDT9658042.1 hypothetical protein [Vibrio vulnificus]HAT8543827.1 hypothetical protein [Vibrio vulnificus]